MHFIDENFWIAISFFIFLYFAYRPIKKAVVKSLDTKINDIKENLAQTEKLKIEAKSLLDEVQNEMNNFQKYKEKLLDSAKTGTERLIDIKTKEMDLILTHKSDSAIKLIEHEKTKAFDRLKDEFTDTVIKLVKNYLIESKNNSVSDEEIINRFVSNNK